MTKTLAEPQALTTATLVITAAVRALAANCDNSNGIGKLGPRVQDAYAEAQTACSYIRRTKNEGTDAGEWIICRGKSNNSSYQFCVSAIQQIFEQCKDHKHGTWDWNYNGLIEWYECSGTLEAPGGWCPRGRPQDCL